MVNNGYVFFFSIFCPTLWTKNLRLTQGYTAAKTESGFEPNTMTAEPELLIFLTYSFLIAG